MTISAANSTGTSHEVKESNDSVNEVMCNRNAPSVSNSQESVEEGQIEDDGEDLERVVCRVLSFRSNDNTHVHESRKEVKISPKKREMNQRV